MFLKFPGKISYRMSDEEMIEEFTSSGNLETLGELYSPYMHLVYGICLKYLKDRDDAMDSVMHIFEKLINDIPKQKIENFSSWLHIVTRNYCLMHLRSKKSSDEKYREWAIDPGNFMENSYELHPIDKERQDMDKDLADCIERLKEEQKKCITQFYYENKSYDEIAENLGMDEKKVKSHLQNGKRNLKLCIEEKNGRKRKE